jgi:hypothetical protein
MKLMKQCLMDSSTFMVDLIKPLMFIYVYFTYLESRKCLHSEICGRAKN